MSWQAWRKPQNLVGFTPSKELGAFIQGVQKEGGGGAWQQVGRALLHLQVFHNLKLGNNRNGGVKVMGGAHTVQRGEGVLIGLVMATTQFFWEAWLGLQFMLSMESFPGIMVWTFLLLLWGISILCKFV